VSWLAALPRTLTLRFWGMAVVGTSGSLLLLGIPAALIPNPVFGRQIEAEPFAYVVWFASAILAGLIVADWLVPAPSRDGPEPHRDAAGEAGLGLGGLVAFLAIGCPICNKIVLVLLGTTGALQLFAPIQPLLGAASVALLAGTLAWRLRARARGCVRCVAAASGPTVPLVD
jgi:hypothetical protein